MSIESVMLSHHLISDTKELAYRTETLTDREPGAKNGVKIVWGGHVHSATFKRDNQQGPTIQHKELCSAYVAAWMGGEFGREWGLV